MKSGRTIAAGFIVLALTAARARAQDPAEQGRALLQENCARCHAIGKTDTSPLEAAPPFRVISQSYELDRFGRYLQRGITSTHPDMPEFRFDEETAAAVVAYLRTIQE
ncbi:MAG: cytochrome c [Pseudolabrys sp.]|nr:cytochrome c [Pseudolabrys sp.]